MLVNNLGFSFFFKSQWIVVLVRVKRVSSPAFFLLSLRSLKYCSVEFAFFGVKHRNGKTYLKTLIVLVRVPSSWSMEKNSPPSVNLVLVSLSFSGVCLSDLHSSFLLFFIREQTFSLSLINMLPFILFIICCSGLHEGGWSWLRHSVGWRPTWLKFIAVASYYYAVPVVLVLRKRQHPGWRAKNFTQRKATENCFIKLCLHFKFF